MKKQLTIGLIGFGCVGTGLYEVLNRSGLKNARIKRIVVKDRQKERPIESEHLSFDVDVILDDPEINVVIELINDSEAALIIVRKALKNGKDVVTANKKLLAEHLDELIALAAANNCSLLYEGAVAGSIPIIRNLEEYYNNDSLTSVEGIVNGTTNYILTRSNSGIGYTEALEEAQNLGFAELDPTLDVDGFDSKYKLVLLLKHAFGLSVKPERVLNIGIRQLKAMDVAFANEKGYRIKLFSRAEKINNEVIGFVAPHFIQDQHPAYTVDNEFNAVIVEALFSDRQLFYGKGAGSHPTASAVLSDLSALKFDYKYEYRKTDDSKNLVHSNQVFVKVYVGSEYIEAINEVPFYHVEDLFQSDVFCYQTGWVKLSDLFALNLNQRKDLSLVILPEAIRNQNSLRSLKENKLLTFEPELS